MNVKKQYARQNNFNRNNYDKFSLMLPKGQKAILQEEAKRRNLSLNALIQEAIKAYVNCTDDN